MHHGMAPYRDIADINMPGAYAVDWLAVHLFGVSSLAFRMFDFALLAMASTAAIAIALPYDWFAGVYCSALFILIHGRDGIAQSGQRDMTVSVLLLAAAALLLDASRKQSMLAMALFGLSCGFASTIKPTFLPLGFVLLLMFAFRQSRSHLPVSRYVVTGVAGLLTPLLLTLLFLLREHSLPAFLDTLENLIPYHASIGRLPPSYFLRHSFASAILPIVLLWLATAVLQKGWRSWEKQVLLVCLAFGLFSLVAQGKGYPYHRYPSEAFLLLLAGLDFTAALRGGRVLRLVGLAGLAFGALFLAPVSTIKAAGYQWQNDEFSTMLQADLNQLGGSRLSEQVQCLDTIGGCIDTLNRMQLVQSTGFLYDCYLFAAKPDPVQTEYRAGFWRALQANPPKVFVVTNELCMEGPSSFEKLQRWPQLDTYLRSRYRLAVERKPPDKVQWWSQPASPASYRIYVESSTAIQPATPVEVRLSSRRAK